MRDSGRTGSTIDDKHDRVGYYDTQNRGLQAEPPETRAKVYAADAAEQGACKVYRSFTIHVLKEKR